MDGIKTALPYLHAIDYSSSECWNAYRRVWHVERVDDFGYAVDDYVANAGGHQSTGKPYRKLYLFIEELGNSFRVLSTEFKGIF